MALVYCCSLDGLIASIVLLICTSLWIKASAKWLNVNVNANRSVENEEACFFVFSMIWSQSHKSCGCRKTFISMSVKSMVITVLSKLRPICIYVCVCVGGCGNSSNPEMPAGLWWWVWLVDFPGIPKWTAWLSHLSRAENIIFFPFAVCSYIWELDGFGSTPITGKLFCPNFRIFD